MKKDKVMIIFGGLLILLQIASFIFDIVQSGALKFMSGFSGDAMMYNVSYLSVGLVGAILILWGILIHNRKEEK